MEVSNTMLVSIMFVTILSIGVGNLLMSLTEYIKPGQTAPIYWNFIFWQGFLLLFHFELFWHSKYIMDVKQWEFEQFLLMMLGPILLLMATTIILSLSKSKNFEQELNEGGQRFFVVFALIQFWMISTDYVMGSGFQWLHLVSYTIIALVVILLLTRSRWVQNFASWGSVGMVAAFMVARIFLE